MADAIYEHKKGKAWQIVGKLERENHTLRYQVRVLQARLRRVAGQEALTEGGELRGFREGGSGLDGNAGLPPSSVNVSGPKEDADG